MPKHRLLGAGFRRIGQRESRSASLLKAKRGRIRSDHPGIGSRPGQRDKTRGFPRAFRCHRRSHSRCGVLHARRRVRTSGGRQLARRDGLADFVSAALLQPYFRRHTCKSDGCMPNARATCVKPCSPASTRRTASRLNSSLKGRRSFPMTPRWPGLRRRDMCVRETGTTSL